VIATAAGAAKLSHLSRDAERSIVGALLAARRLLQLDHRRDP
jgi:hypothetical protein